MHSIFTGNVLESRCATADPNPAANLLFLTLAAS